MRKNKYGTMWVARDIVGNLFLFRVKPFRNDTTWEFARPDGINERDYEAITSLWMELDKDLFPDLKWEDEPIEVSLIPNEINEKELAKKTLEEALAARFCGFITEGETPGMTDLNIFEYAYKLGVINTLGLFKMPKDLMTIAQMEELEKTKELDETKKFSN